MKKLALTLVLLLILTCTSAIAEPDTSEDPYGAMSTEERNDLIKTLLSCNMRESIATYDTTREFEDQSRRQSYLFRARCSFCMDYRR